MRVCSFPAKFFLYEELKFSLALQYSVWVLYPVLLILFAVGFCHIVSPQAVGEQGGGLRLPHVCLAAVRCSDSCHSSAAADLKVIDVRDRVSELMVISVGCGMGLACSGKRFQ